jgi:hypothetical protein
MRAVIFCFEWSKNVDGGIQSYVHDTLVRYASSRSGPNDNNAWLVRHRLTLLLRRFGYRER